MENNEFMNKMIQKANQIIQTLNSVETKGRQNFINLVNSMTLIEQLVKMTAEQVQKLNAAAGQVPTTKNND